MHDASKKNAQSNKWWRAKRMTRTQKTKEEEYIVYAETNCFIYFFNLIIETHIKPLAFMRSVVLLF